LSISIPQHKIDEVRSASDVLDLVSGYVTLKKSGRNYFGLCPFHPEKTPSFSVNPDKQIFHCFGCGAGGNVFTFLMRHEGISFPEAVKFLAQRAGIRLEFEERDETVNKENETLYYTNEFAARFFQETLLSSTGKDALRYLNDRGFKMEDIQTFGLGYAPPGWDNLLNHAKKESIGAEQLVRAGLVIKKDDGSYYDRFRDRVMFSIWNLSGRVVAFGGRKLREEDDSPKYLNSPETAVYEKGKLLYGLYQTRDEIRQQDCVIFVEGYTDLMSLAARGVKNVVATLGTALTEDHARLIRRYTKNVALMYDSDSAGSAATLRGADILLAGGLDVSVATLPAGHDPDSFARAVGADAVREHVAHAVDLFDFKLNQVLAQPPEKRTEGIRSLLDSLAKLVDSIKRSLLLQRVSEALQIQEKILWEELEAVLRQKRIGQTRRSQLGERLTDLSRVSKINKKEAAVADLLRILIRDWSQAEFIFNDLDTDEVSDSRLISVLSYLKNLFKSGGRLEEMDLINRFNEVETSEFIVNVIKEPWSEVDLPRWAGECVATIKIKNLQVKLNAIREQLREAQSRGQPVKELLSLCKELEEEKRKWQDARRETSNVKS
jgi:DNA primase